MRNLPDVVGGVHVERKHQGGFIPTTGKRAVLHTTEGGFEGSDSVLVANGVWPNAMFGRDKTGKLRIIEYAPIGAMGKALANPPGGVETNTRASYQIEVVGFRQLTGEIRMSPGMKAMTDAERKVLAALMVEVKKTAGVPLARGGDGSRSVANWMNHNGWFGHVEVPENDHTDPGAHQYNKTFAMARAQLAPWRLVENRKVIKRGTFKDLRAWISSHRDRIRKQGGVSIKPNA